jgi:nucleoside-diphosphate kinase
LAIIKPDAVAKGTETAIKLLIHQAGFHIVAERKIALTQTSAEEFYAEHSQKPFYARLTQFMSRYYVFGTNVNGLAGLLLFWYSQE